MRDSKYLEIKKRMLNRSMELWGIKDSLRLDPVIDLLLDVFAYETAKLHQELQVSDSQLLHRLARILVSNKWSLPMPAHGLLMANPNQEESVELNPADHFFTEKKIFGDIEFPVFFTSIAHHQLLNMSIKCLAFDNRIDFFEENDRLYVSNFLGKEKIPDCTYYIGFSVNENLLQQTESLSLCIRPYHSDMLPFLKLLKVFNNNGSSIPIAPMSFHIEKSEKNHYINDIVSFYKDIFFELNIKGVEKEQKTITETFSDYKSIDIGDIEDEKMFWLKLVFPPIFNREHLNDLEVLFNTFPIVNRQLKYKQHHFKMNGRIVSLPSPNNNFFLNVKNISDNIGNAYENVLDENHNESPNTYSIYFGNLERFDIRSAKSIINKLSQLVREEGNAFASIHPESFGIGLKELLQKLETLEERVRQRTDKSIAEKERTFLLTNPDRRASHYEIEYYVTNGDAANGFDERAMIHEYEIKKYSNLSLKSTITLGTVRKEEQQLINSLRYGLLARERIVSSEDIKSFVEHQIGKHTQSIEIKSGVDISPDKNKGIIRTTEVHITLKHAFLEKKDLDKYAFFLEQELEKKSMIRTPYKIIFNHE